MPLGLLGHISATWHLMLVSVRRLVRSRQTMVSLLLMGFASVAVLAWTMRRTRSPADFTEHVFLAIYASVLLPIFCLSYGTAGIASDREERTLVYLLVAPLPRPLVFLAKTWASLLPALAWTLGGLWLLCRFAGSPGLQCWSAIWPSVFWATCAYVALFLLFSVVFRRATLLAMAYALFLETLVGNLPGIAKRLTISFYLRSMVIDETRDLGLRLGGPLQPELFLPIAGNTALGILIGLTAGLFLAGLVVFATREYTS